MRRPAVVLLLGALLSAVGIWAAAPAQACDCSTGTTAENADWADAVFTGRLVDSEQGSPDRWGNAPIVLVFAVDTVVKGEVLERQEIVTPSSSASCGVVLSGSGPFAVFGRGGEDAGGLVPLEADQYASHMCDGTDALTPALQAELEALPGVGPPAAPAAAPPPRSAAPEEPDDGTAPVVAGLAGLAALGAAGLLVLRRRRPGDDR